MGLDLVELVMAVEEEFEIEISDSAASRMRTPRDMIDFIDRKIGKPGKKVPVRMRAFYRFRNACLKNGIGDRSTIKPSAPLGFIFPRPTRARQWRIVGKALGVPRWPKLGRLTWVCALLWIVAASVSLGVTSPWKNGLENIPFAVALFGILGGFLFGVTGFLRTEFQPSLKTVRDVVEQIALMRPKALREPNDSLNRDEIAAIVKKIVCDYCDPGSYSENAEFVRDLGMD